MKTTQFLKLVAGLFVLWVEAPIQGATLIQNADFETGLFTPWTLFTTPGGDISDTFNTVPAVLQFDVAGVGSNTFAATLSVGRDRFNGQPGQQGGGLFQDFSLNGATNLQFSLHVAAQYDFPVGGNNDGGTFQLLLDGVVIDSWASGQLLAGQIKRDTLAGIMTNVPAGNHEIRITMLRNFDQADDTYQYVDDVMVVPVPEPSPCWFVVCALSAAGTAWRHSQCKKIAA